jgi:hypothetical protein
MTTERFPRLDDASLGETRDTLHAYARVCGEWATTCRLPRKHWWQGSLRPSLSGLTTGVIYAAVDFELELDLRRSELRARTSDDDELVEPLVGQSARDLAARIGNFLIVSGLDPASVPAAPDATNESTGANYTAGCAQTIARAWADVTGAMTALRAGIREETSPIQVWPHHFDLSMVWLPGETIPGQDPNDPENADKQMNFGFTLGDGMVPEPYFYVTAYPSPEAFASLVLPAGTTWRTSGFTGAVLPYASLIASRDPRGYLLDLWNVFLVAGRQHMLAPARTTTVP